MKKITCLLLTLLCMNSHAGISSNFGVVSDYVWRGQTQTNNGAAIQGGMDYEHTSGLSAGTWVSNLANSGAEADFYARYSHSFNENISGSLGGTFYHYTKSGTSDTTELNLALNLWMLDFSVNYTNDYFGTDTSSFYYNVATSIDLIKTEGLSLGLSIGQTSFDDEIKAGSTDYIDYKASLDRKVNEYTISLFYTDTNRKTKTSATEADTEDHVYGVGVSRSF